MAAARRQQFRTADYPEEARKRLGRAVADARLADGYPYQSSFAKAAGISRRSLVDLEDGKPGIGKSVIERVGQALTRQGWTKSTPAEILGGASVPNAAAPPEDAPESSRVDAPVTNPDEVLREHFRKLWDASPDRETFFRIVAEELADLRSERPSDTEGDRSSEAG